MTNPFATLKRLFEGAPDLGGPSEPAARRVEKNFMKYDLTVDSRF